MGLFQTGQFPYTDLNNLNLDWIIQQIKQNVDNITSLTEQVSGYLNAANQYTDQKFQDVLQVVNQTLVDFREDLQADYEQFVTQVDNNLIVLQQDFQQLRDDMDAEIVGVNARTDAAIEQNNEYIFEKIGQELIDAKVVNYFTGQLVTLQQMFDYLAQFHLTNAIDYDTLAGRNNTYTQLVALNITYTQLATDGGALIPQE